MSAMVFPRIIQGGMGVGVSNWRLAGAVTKQGQLGVVSGTALDVVLARRLQEGDLGGHMLRALRHFPIIPMATRIAQRYFTPVGKHPNARYQGVPMASHRLAQDHLELIVVANFVEVYLAKKMGGGPVGINLLEKIQFPTLAALYGAMLADVDYVLMGAGIPNHIPGVLDRLAAGEDAELKIDVAGAPAGETHQIRFSPDQFFGGVAPKLQRPRFLPIISSATLAMTLARKSNGTVDGFIVEGSTAGGHNAPPRGAMQLNERGEPIYGPRDWPDLDKIRELGRPFWLAGDYGSAEKIQEALSLGATGVQIGTAFAFCEESGMSSHLKQQVLQMVRAGQIEVKTDPLASPTGFPFKVVQVPGSVSEEHVRDQRDRVCDVGLLRQAYRREDGSIGFRCASEPSQEFVRKGGEPEAIDGRQCVCNGLLASIDLPQIQPNGEPEPPLVTAGDCLSKLASFLPPGKDKYTVADVLKKLELPAAKTVARVAVTA